MDRWHVVEQSSRPPGFKLLLEHVLSAGDADYEGHLEELFASEDSFSGGGVVWLAHLRVDELLPELVSLFSCFCSVEKSCVFRELRSKVSFQERFQKTLLPNF